MSATLTPPLPGAEPRPLAAARAARRAGRAVSALALVVVATLAVAVLVAAAADVRPHVEASDSMRPLLRAGDLVWLDAIAARRARVGDVIAFAHPDRGDVVLHRVAAVGAAPGGRLRFVTRGDANSGGERWTIARTGSVGRYAGVRVPGAGRAVHALRGGALPWLSALSAFVLAASALRRVWR